METKLEYLLNSVNTLRFRNVEIKYFRKMGICITVLNIGPSLHCSIGNKIVFWFVSALKLVYFSDLLGFKYACFCL